MFPLEWMLVENVRKRQSLLLSKHGWEQLHRAYSKVLEKRESDREDAGIVVFKHYGVNQDRQLVAEIERTALIKKKSHWLQR